MSEQVLTKIELMVIALARGDPPSSLVQRRGFVRQIFGDCAPRPLAAPRLEALRRYAILRRVHGPALAEAEHGRLRDAGFGDLQMIAIHDLINA
jgi:hypothetical protein